MAIGLLFVVGVADASTDNGRPVSSGGVSVTVPNGWSNLHLAPAPHGAKVNDPVTLLVVASSAINFGLGCNDIDYVIGPRGVAIVVLEWRLGTPGATWAPRPRHFTSTNLPVKPGSIECWTGPGASVQFAQAGRRFAAFVLARPGAKATTIASARRVLDSLRVR